MCFRGKMDEKLEVRTSSDLQSHSELGVLGTKISSKSTTALFEIMNCSLHENQWQKHKLDSDPSWRKTWSILNCFTSHKAFTWRYPDSWKTAHWFQMQVLKGPVIAFSSLQVALPSTENECVPLMSSEHPTFIRWHWFRRRFKNNWKIMVKWGAAWDLNAICLWPQCSHVVWPKRVFPPYEMIIGSVGFNFIDIWWHSWVFSEDLNFVCRSAKYIGQCRISNNLQVNSRKPLRNMTLVALAVIPVKDAWSEMQLFWTITSFCWKRISPSVCWSMGSSLSIWGITSPTKLHSWDHSADSASDASGLEMVDATLPPWCSDSTLKTCGMWLCKE